METRVVRCWRKAFLLGLFPSPLFAAAAALVVVAVGVRIRGCSSISVALDGKCGRV